MTMQDIEKLYGLAAGLQNWLADVDSSAIQIVELIIEPACDAGPPMLKLQAGGTLWMSDEVQTPEGPASTGLEGLNLDKLKMQYLYDNQGVVDVYTSKLSSEALAMLEAWEEENNDEDEEDE